MKRRHISLDSVLLDRIDIHSAKTGVSMSALVADAVRTDLDKRTAKERDDLLSMQMRRLKCHVQVLLETQALFIRYQVTVMPPVPEADKAAIALAHDRFRAFIDQVGRRIAIGPELNLNLLLRDAAEKAA